MQNSEFRIKNSELRMQDKAKWIMDEKYDLKKRTKAFALRVIKLCEALPNTMTASVIAKQLVRCGTSVGANYRAACHARSQADFIAKLGIVREECDESIYWMELLIESGLMTEKRLQPLMDEANELLSIVISSIKTAKRKKST